jgi:hypothetical protein
LEANERSGPVAGFKTGGGFWPAPAFELEALEAEVLEAEVLDCDESADFPEQPCRNRSMSGNTQTEISLLVGTVLTLPPCALIVPLDGSIATLFSKKEPSI